MRWPAVRAPAGRRVHLKCWAMGKESRRKRQERSPGPHSGQILGAVVNALDVGEGVLADKTVKRMFAGRSVSEYSRKERLVAFAQALVDLGIIPDVDDRLRKGKFHDGITTADIMADAIGVTCGVWDQLMERVQSHSVRYGLRRSRSAVSATGYCGRRVTHDRLSPFRPVGTA